MNYHFYKIKMSLFELKNQLQNVKIGLNGKGSDAHAVIGSFSGSKPKIEFGKKIKGVNEKQ